MRRKTKTEDREATDAPVPPEPSDLARYRAALIEIGASRSGNGLGPRGSAAVKTLQDIARRALGA